MVKTAPKVDISTEVAAATKALLPAAKRLAKAFTGLDPKALPIGAVSDLLYDMKQVSKLLGSLSAPFSDVVDPAIKAFEEHFVQTLAVGEASGVQGKHSRSQVTESVVPAVEDWDKFYEHIRKKKEFELLNRAVNVKAVRERWDNKKQVPGVGKFHIKKISCTKLSGK